MDHHPARRALLSRNSNQYRSESIKPSPGKSGTKNMFKSTLLPAMLILGAALVQPGTSQLHAQQKPQPTQDAKALEKAEEERKRKEQWAQNSRHYNAKSELCKALLRDDIDFKILQIDPGLLAKNSAIVRAGIDGAVACEGGTSPIARKNESRNIEAQFTWGYWTGKDKTKLPTMRNYNIKVSAIDDGTHVKVTELTVTEDTPEFMAKIHAKRQELLKALETQTGLERGKTLYFLIDQDRYIGDYAQCEKYWAEFKTVVTDPKIMAEAENNLLNPMKIAKTKHDKFVEAVDAYNASSAAK
jgi:hypothetical protein